MPGRPSDLRPMTTPALHEDDERLRPLLARIWRDYLSQHKTPLFASIACAIAAGGLNAATLKLLEPAINGLFLDQTVPVKLWGVIAVSPDQALWAIPGAIVVVAIICFISFRF